jgi:prepilin signal peptidase PulO-like enzyme (type II secretory pathway)
MAVISEVLAVIFALTATVPALLVALPFASLPLFLGLVTFGLSMLIRSPVLRRGTDREDRRDR